jgi:hypothetical protein
VKGWIGSRIACGVIQSKTPHVQPSTAYYSSQRDNGYRLPAATTGLHTFYIYIRTRLYTSKNWTVTNVLLLCASLLESFGSCIDSWLLPVNELQIPWEKTVTVAGWQMVQTPNYIAPAIGAFFFFFIAGHWNFDKKLENMSPGSDKDARSLLS